MMTWTAGSILDRDGDGRRTKCFRLLTKVIFFIFHYFTKLLVMRELQTVLGVVWVDSWGGGMVVPDGRHVPHQTPWSSIKPVDPLVWLLVARGLVILQPASQMDHVGHTETRGTKQSDGQLSSLATEIMEPRKYLVSAGNLFPWGAPFPPYLCRGQSSALPVASPSSSSHNIVLTKLLFRGMNWKLYLPFPSLHRGRKHRHDLPWPPAYWGGRPGSRQDHTN